MKIRTAKISDQQAIQELYLNSFPINENERVAELAIDLLSEKHLPSVISLVSTNDGDIIAHIAFSPVTTLLEDKLAAYLLAPLAVSPKHQKSGVGSRLVRQGLKELSALGIGHVLVYGDPNYYGRFGFCEDIAKGFLPPYELQFPHGWLGLRMGNSTQTSRSDRISCIQALQDPALW